MISTKNRAILSLLLMTLFLILYFTRYFISVNTYYVNAAMIVVGWLAYVLVLFKRRINKKIGIMLAFDIFSLIAMSINNNFPITYWFLAISYQGIVLSFLFLPPWYRKKGYSIINFFFLLFVLIVLFYIIIGRDTNSILNKASENFISVILLSFFAIFTHYVIKYRKSERMIFEVWIICMALSILAKGRAGIFCFALFGILYFICALYKRVNHKKVFISFCFVFMIMLLTFLTHMYSKAIDTMLSSEGRLNLWSQYFEETKAGGFKSVIFGTTFENNEIFIRWNKNLHNSYLEIHMMYGIAPIFLLLISLLIFIFGKSNTCLKIVFLCILLRAFTDSFLIGELSDFPMYMLLMNGLICNLMVFKTSISYNNQILIRGKLWKKLVQTM